jgi:alcohol dehydrogenase class IV
MLHNFEFGMECPVVFGPGSISCVGERFKIMGGARVFVVTGPNISRAGLIDPALTAIKDAGLEYMVYNDVKPDPLDDACDAAAEAAAAFGADCVLGIGGGSPQDVAKAVSVLLANPGKKALDFALSKGLVFPKRIPLIIAPTASGTGSEVSRIAVLSDHKTHAKDALLCSGDLAIVDPDLAMTTPPSITAASGFDCLSHALEASTAFNRNPFGRLIALHAMKLIFENLPKCYDDGSDREARDNMAFASTLAGAAFNNTSVHIGHAVAHELGGVFGLAHGYCCAVTGVEVAKHAVRADITLGLDIAEAMGLQLTSAASTEAVCQAVEKKLRGLYRYCGAKTLREYGISREAAIACAEGAIKHNVFWNHGPSNMNAASYRNIIGKMWDLEAF